MTMLRQRNVLLCCFTVLILCVHTSATSRSQQTSTMKPRKQKPAAPDYISPNLQTKPLTTEACPDIASCYKPRANDDVRQAQASLVATVEKEQKTYEKLSRRLQSINFPANTTISEAYTSSLARHRVVYVSGVGRQAASGLMMISSPAAKSAKVYQDIAKNCLMLQASFDASGLSGLSTFVSRIAASVKRDGAVGTRESANHTVDNMDSMYDKLDDVKHKLTVSPKITSLPTGAKIAIATRAQAALGRFEFFGETDARGINMYRGIYIYTISANGFTTFSGELNLIDNPGRVIACEKQSDVQALYCNPQ